MTALVCRHCPEHHQIEAEESFFFSGALVCAEVVRKYYKGFGKQGVLEELRFRRGDAVRLLAEMAKRKGRS